MAKRKVWTQAAAPVDGVAGSYANLTEKGDLLADSTNGRLYQNTNTKGSPTWTDVASAIPAGSVTQAELAPASLDGTIAKLLADASPIGGIPLVRYIPIADASGDTNVVVSHKERVLDFEFLNTGIAASATLDTVQLKNLATAITDAVAKTATVNAKVRALTYDPAQTTIAAAGTLRITAVKTINVAGVAIVTSVRVA